MANELSTRTQQKTGIATYLGGEATRANIAGVIGKENVTRFVSSVVSAVQANPQLASCTNASIVSAALQGEALKLAPSPQLGHFYMTPYKTRKKVNGEWVESTEAQFQIGLTF
jgi:recombination protein RecT